MCRQQHGVEFVVEIWKPGRWRPSDKVRKDHEAVDRGIGR